MITRFLYDKIIEEVKESNFNFRILKYDLPYLIYLNLPKIFSIFIIFIIKHNSKRKSDVNVNNMERKYHIFVKSSNNKKLFLIIFIISFLEVIGNVGDHLLYYYQKIHMNPEDEPHRLGWLVEKKNFYIIFVPLFCYLFLKNEIHRHHVFALFLGCIGAFVINLARFVYHFAKLDKLFYHFLNIVLSSFFSLVIVLTKYIMSKFLINSPYIFIFYEGLFSILTSLLVALLIYPLIINLPDYNVNINIEEENEKYFYNNYFGIINFLIGQNFAFYIFFFMSIILSFIYYILSALTIYNYSPYLLILVDSFLPIDGDIIFIILKRKDFNVKDAIKRTVFQSFGYAILFCASLILNEMIVLNFWGFSDNTIEKINLRSHVDSNSLELHSIETEISDVNDDDSDINSQKDGSTFIELKNTKQPPL
jgi:hypothetical protein